MNTLFHESSSKNKHRGNEGYAIARGNSAQSNYFLRNHGNKNTNVISSKDWNTRESIREEIKGGGVLRRGNEYNRRAYLGSGERDEMGFISKEILKQFVKQGSKKGIKEGGKKVGKPDQTPSKQTHIFDKKQHNLDDFLESFGGNKEKALS